MQKISEELQSLRKELQTLTATFSIWSSKSHKTQIAILVITALTAIDVVLRFIELFK